MSKNKELRDRDRVVYSYLMHLGYSSSQIASEVTTEQGNKVDFVVYNKNRPWIVVELKKTEDISGLRESPRLKVHPSIRQLQFYATTLKAPYYLLTNADDFIWLTTDKSGRPQLLNEPIIPSSDTDFTFSQLTEQNILWIFRQLRDLFYEKNNRFRTDILGVLIFAKLLSDKKDKRLENYLNRSRNENLDSILPSIFSNLIEEARNYPNIEQAFEILNQVSLRTANPPDLINSIDKVFLFYEKNKQPRIPRWLADFLVRISNLQRGDTLLDISVGYGDILAASSMLKEQDFALSILGISFDEEGFIWAKIQQVILGEEDSSIVFENPLNFDISESLVMNSPTHIITAPPFGKVNYLHFSQDSFSSKLNQLEDLLLERALSLISAHGRIVMLVPESLLFSKTRKKIRDLLIRNNYITAIISLSSGILKPTSAIKTSILILDKKSNIATKKVFMSYIDELPVLHTFNSREIPKFNEVLETFKNWEITNHIDNSSVAWEVSTTKLHSDNLAVHQYVPSSPVGHKELNFLYPMVNLKEVVKLIKRGARIKLEEHGNIQVIGPGSIRQMVIDAEKLGQTSSTQVPLEAMIVQDGDVTFNNISTYLGAAAVVKSLENTYVSQHVILIRPNTSVILPDYLAAALNSDYVRPQVEQRATGAIMPSLSLRELEKIKIPLPDLNTQQRLVNKIINSQRELTQMKQQLIQAEKNFLNTLKHLLLEN